MTNADKKRAAHLLRESAERMASYISLLPKEERQRYEIDLRDSKRLASLLMNEASV